MNENYIVINGRKTELTEEQLIALGIEKERKNPFAKVCRGENFFYTSALDLCSLTEFNTIISKRLSESGNYFNDKQFAYQVDLHQLLYRKLLKFAYDNKCEDNQMWGSNETWHWIIRYNFEDRRFEPEWSAVYKYGGVYFSDREGAERAIKEVVEPFVKEHPDFVW